MQTLEQESSSSAPPQKDGILAGYEDRIKGLETQTGNIRERLARIETKLEPIPAKPINPFLAGVISFVSLALLWYLGWSGTQIVKQGTQISQILVILSPEIVKKASSNPTDPNSAKQAKEILDKAEKHGERIDPAIVSESGRKFVEASDRQPEAWDAALAFLNYNSFLNASLTPDLSSIKLVGPTQKFSWYDYNSPIGHQGQLYRIGIATSDFPQLRLIEHPDKNAGQNVGPEFLLIKNAEILLDDTYMKKVIIQDSRIVYKGGPVKLENVLFVNCQFDVQPTSQGKAFANSALSHTPITFTSS